MTWISFFFLLPKHPQQSQDTPVTTKPTKSKTPTTIPASILGASFLGELEECFVGFEGDGLAFFSSDVWSSGMGIDMQVVPSKEHVSSASQQLGPQVLWVERHV